MSSKQTTFLCIGDQHMDTVNAPTIDIFIQEVLRHILDTNPDYIVCMGDMLHYHNTVYTPTLNKSYEFIDRISRLKPTYIIVGNHDMRGPSCFLDEQSHWMNALKKWENVVIVDKVVSLDIPSNRRVIFVPYVPPKRFIDALDTLSGWGDSSCIFAHQEFYGCKMGAIDSVEGDKWDINHPPVISGHIHDRQRSQENIFYTGSSIQTSFGDSSDKTISLVTVYDTPQCTNTVGGITFRDHMVHSLQLELRLPKKKILYMNVGDLPEWKLPDKVLKDEDTLTDTYRLTVKGTPAEFKVFKKSSKYKEIIRQDIKVVFKHSNQQPKVLEVDNKSQNTCTSFQSILLKLIEDEKDEGLRQELLHYFREISKKS